MALELPEIDHQTTKGLEVRRRGLALPGPFSLEFLKSDSLDPQEATSD